ncbi:MAG: YbgA family protein [Candidatus Tectimicrobiota bacterium]
MSASLHASGQPTPATSAPIRLGISSCLLGTKVRYDGGHKRDAFIVDTLGQFFQWVPVCPETEIGLSTPRESLRLVGTAEAPHLITQRTQQDLTASMQHYADARVAALAQLHLHGFLLKKDSPSCGMERVRVYDQQGAVKQYGRGLFAACLMQRLPLLPVEDEGRLHDMRLRENFIERVFAYHRWLTLCDVPPSPSDVVRFHRQHKLALLAHSREHYQDLGRLIARAGTLPIDELLAQYGAQFMTCLKVKATPKKHANVLYHLLGHLKKQLDTDDKQEVIACIEQYRQELLPLVVPLTLLQHHFRRHPVPWVLEQTYLQPYPAELMLRNHV